MSQAYYELEDVDDLVGIAAVRKCTSLEEKIVEADSVGNYDDELLYYEQLLAERPNDIDLQLGYLRCLRTLGHWEIMFSHAENLLQQKPKNAGIVSLATEAAWRLSKWDKLEQLSNANSPHRFVPSVLPLKLTSPLWKAGGRGSCELTLPFSIRKALC